MMATWQGIYGKYAEQPILFVAGAIGLGLVAAITAVFSESLLWPIAMAVGLLLLWVIVTYPDFGLAVLVFAVYTRLTDVLEHEHGLPSLGLPAALLILGVVFWRWWNHDEKIHDWENTAVVVGIYIFICFTSLLYAADPSRSQSTFISLIKDIIILFAVLLTLRHQLSLQYTIWGLIIAGILMGTLTVYQQLTGTFEDTYFGLAQTDIKNIVGSVNDYRSAGPVGDPNFYARALVFVVPLALDRVWHQRNIWLRLLAGWSLLVCLLAIVYTFSRGGFLSAILVIMIMVLRYSLKPLTILLSLAALLIVWQYVPDNYTERLATTLDLLPGSDAQAQAEVSFRGRSSEVLVAWQMLLEHPLMGVGLNNYKHYYQEYARVLGWDNRREERSAHNLYLEVAAETGLIGLVAFCAIIIAALWGSYQAQNTFLHKGHDHMAMISWALIAGAIGYLMASMFLHGSYPRYFWLMIGIMMALPAIANNIPTQEIKKTHEESWG